MIHSITCFLHLSHTLSFIHAAWTTNSEHCVATNEWANGLSVCFTVTDFSAVVIGHTRLVRITRDLYQQQMVLLDNNLSSESLPLIRPALPLQHSTSNGSPISRSSSSSSSSLMMTTNHRVVRSDRWQLVADAMPAPLLCETAAAHHAAYRTLSSPDDDGGGILMSPWLRLQGMSVSALKRKARKLGASQAALDEADDALNIKSALIQIIRNAGGEPPTAV